MARDKLDFQKRQKRERGQLVHRKKLGILEKHKDYVLRARDYHSKESRLKKLQKKASERNKDEFYFGMINQKTKVWFFFIGDNIRRSSGG
jgi:U3 small nucleolar RNA-associated protein 11